MLVSKTSVTDNIHAGPIRSSQLEVRCPQTGRIRVPAPARDIREKGG